MSCDCQSYNLSHLDRKTPNVTLQTPHGMYQKTSICVDACLADLVLEMWRRGIKTADCCCGHGKMIPYVMVYDPADVPSAAEVIRASGREPMHVMAWSHSESKAKEEDDDRV